MNTLEWYHDTIDHLITFIGKEVTTPTETVVVGPFNSRTREFALIGENGTRYVYYLELDRMIGLQNS
jgi:hypothetical protein